MKPSEMRETRPDLYKPKEISREEYAASYTAAISEEGGTKHDQGKPELDLIPTTALIAEAAALSYGKQKYGRNNYKKGFEYSRLIAACLRHLMAFKDGEDKDSESGASHLGHARACLAILIDNQATGVGKDDR